MMVRVKICGITSARDAVAAVAAGADALGFNFFPPSPRYVEPELAHAIGASLPPFVATVGIFVDEEPRKVNRICGDCGLRYAQLHGHESPRRAAAVKAAQVIKAIRVREESDLKQLGRFNAAAYLLDTYVPEMPGGTGQTFDWELARRAASRGKIILAGGLTPENVARAVAAARPYAVDVAGGVEQEPGVKSRRLLAEFVRAAKSVDL